MRNRRLTNLALVVGLLHFLVAGFIRHDAGGAAIGVFLAMTPWLPFTKGDRA